jgi:hypothetical protein
MPPRKAKPAPPPPGDGALLPERFEEFRSLSYWDGFFQKARAHTQKTHARTRSRHERGRANALTLSGCAARRPAVRVVQ